MKIFLFVLVLILNCSVFALKNDNNFSEFLPNECRINCETPYGKNIGVSFNVKSFSNCNSKCINKTGFESIKINTTGNSMTGIKWQCVEYARRWLIINKKITFDQVENAYNIWDKDYAINTKNNKRIGFKRVHNGNSNPPEFGDLLIYRKSDKLPYGHVAVIVNVNFKEKFIDVAEENYENKMWQDFNKYSRRIKLIKLNNKYFVSDIDFNSLKDDKSASQIYGWKKINK